MRTASTRFRCQQHGAFEVPLLAAPTTAPCPRCGTPCPRADDQRTQMIVPTSKTRVA